MKLSSTTLALAVGITILAHATDVSAYARYKSSSPAKGEVLSAPPAKVDILFSEDIQNVAGTYGIEVERDRGRSVNAGSATVDDSDRTRVTIRLQPALTAGRYIVKWTNISDDDGDPANGAFSFYLQTQPNAVDLANDQQLESIGIKTEATPVAATAAAVTSAVAGSPTPAATGGAGTPTVVAPGIGTGGSSNNTGLYVTIGVIAAVVAAIAAGLGVVRNRAMRRR